MNRRKNLLCVFFLVLTVLSCTLEVDVFATSGGKTEQPGSVATSESPASQTISQEPASQPDQGQPAQGSPASSQTAVSSQAASSKQASSSPASSKAVRRRSSSSVAVSSEIVSSEESSDVSSEESSGSESSISLPGVGSVAENDPLSSAITNPEQTHRMNMQGILAWACIALGVLVVLIVVLSNRRPPRGPGRKRYRRPKRSNRKRLLNDRYYRNLNRY